MTVKTAQERYAIARNTNNLKSDPRTTHSASDVLAAAGMASQDHADAMMLWEVAFQGKTHAKMALVEVLARSLMGYMLANGHSGEPRHIAMEVLAWWLHGVCTHCGGRGHEVIPDTPTLSDTLCQHCHGTGKMPFPQSDPHRWLKARMEKMTGIAGSCVMRRLDERMNLGNEKDLTAPFRRI